MKGHMLCSPSSLTSKESRVYLHSDSTRLFLGKMGQLSGDKELMILAKRKSRFFFS
jgi:hypothetical protein